MNDRTPTPCVAIANSVRHGLGLLLALLLLPGCSARAWYEGGRASAESECRKLPPGGYEDCMRRVNRQSYEDYEKERQRR